MTNQERWAASQANDASFDGAFFYAVKTTQIFCRPSCKSKTPLRANVTFFDTAQEAQQAGYRPCKRCRPDLLEYQPVRELAQQAKALIDTSMQRRIAFAQELRTLGITQHRMAEIFKEHYGVSISEYIRGLRLSKAQALLSETDLPILDVAFQAGFESVSAFYRFFRKQTGCSPAAYRAGHRISNNL